MKAVILAGGKGTRISEESYLRPKPLIEIGGKPIIWHIMKIYSAYGINEFIICCGYKGYMVKEYFANYFLHTSDVTFHLDQDNLMEVHRRNHDKWKVTLIDTGENTQTGGRLLRVRDFIHDEVFCFTYGDGLSDVNINKIIEFNKLNKSIATVTAVPPPGRFGNINLKNNDVINILEKIENNNSWINGGFFVLNKDIFDNIKGDECSFEIDVLPKLVAKNQFNAYKHTGFWQPMDTLRDHRTLEELWNNEQALWKIWQ